MKNTWRKLLAAFCAASMLMTMPGVLVYASDYTHEDIVESCEDLPDEMENAWELPSEALTEISEEPAENADLAEVVAPDPEEQEGAAVTVDVQEAGLPADETTAEETVGAGSGTYTVGDDVKAKYDATTGSIVLYSTVAAGGTLGCGWADWQGIGKSSIKSISVAPNNKVKFPEFTNYAIADEDPVYLFAGLDNLTSIDCKGFDTSETTDMSCLFRGCKSLKTVDLSSFDTSNVSNMSGMFSGCTSLTSVNLSSFNTSNLVGMDRMFYGCKSLKTIDLSNFNTSNVEYMARMFDGCENLTRLDLRNFNTSRVTEMYYMFNNCKRLKYLDLGSFNMSIAYDANKIIAGCNALDILITPRNRRNGCECPLPYTMYDRNGKTYKEIPRSTTCMVLGRTKALASSIFIDVRDPSHAYYNAIYWAVDKGITKGYSDGTFGIDRSCTRGEMVMFLWRYAGQPAPKTVSKSPFKDVPTSHTFYKAILWAYQKGITKGYSDGSFGVNRNVSRGESMMFLWRLKGKKEPTAVSVSPFKDVPKTHTFYKAILWGYQKKITTGYTSGSKKGTFGINENCTRGQIVTFLYRAK